MKPVEETQEIAAEATLTEAPPKAVDLRGHGFNPANSNPYLRCVQQLTPDWRHREAQHAVNRYLSARHSAPPLLDPSVEPFFWFLLEVPHAEHSFADHAMAQRYLANIDGPKFLAHNIYQHHARSLRTFLEARILCGQTDEEISKLCDIPEDAVKAYADLYFDVRPRLRARDWICSEVIGPLFQTGDQQWQAETIAKYFGYFGGPLVLDAVLNGTNTGQTPCTEPENLGNWLESAFRFKLKVQTSVMMTVYQPSRFDVTDLISGYTTLASLELRERDLIGEDNILTQVLDAVKMQNPILLGDAAQFSEYSEGVYDKKGVVPRVHERLELSRGHVPDQLQKYTVPEYKGPLDADRTRKPDQSRHTSKGD